MSELENILEKAEKKMEKLLPFEKFDVLIGYWLKSFGADKTFISRMKQWFSESGFADTAKIYVDDKLEPDFIVIDLSESH